MAAAIRSVSKRIPRMQHVEPAERAHQVVDLIEGGPLVLLQVAVVGEREAFQHRQQPGRGRPTAVRPALPRAASAASGFFFCGIIEEPVAAESSSSANPYRDVHSTSSSDSRDRCTMQSAAA